MLLNKLILPTFSPSIQVRVIVLVLVRRMVIIYFEVINKHTYLHTRALSGQHSDPCALSALEPFFCDFSAARPRFVARLAHSDSPQSQGPCPRADPPSPWPSRSACEVARSRLRGLPHAPRSQPCFFTTTSLLGSSYSPCLLYTSPSPRDRQKSRMPSSA